MANPIYPGLQTYDEQRGRRVVHRAQRRQDLFGLIAALPNLVNTLGAVRASGDRESDQALFAQRLQEAIANPRGELAPGEQGPAYPPEMAAAQEAAQVEPEGFFHRLARTASLGLSGDRQPQLGPQQVLAIAEAARGARGEQDTNAYRQATLEAGARDDQREDFWRRIQAQNAAIDRQRSGRRLQLDEAKAAAEGPVREADIGLKRALAIKALRGDKGAGGGITPATAATNLRTYQARLAAANGDLARLRAAPTPEDKRLLETELHTNEEALTREIADLGNELDYWGDAMETANPSQKRTRTWYGDKREIPTDEQKQMTPGPVGRQPSMIERAKSLYRSDPDVQQAIDAYKQEMGITGELTDQDWMAAIATATGGR